MNYEEKYKEALEWMRSIYPTMQGADKEDAEHHFPELCELEDERIRKAIICGMNALKEQHKETFASIPINDCITWLEKQDEKSVCKVKIGETYKCIASPIYTCFRNGDTYHVTDNFVAELINICSDCFVLLEKQGEHKCDCEYVGCHVNDVKRWCHKKQAEILYEKCNTECPEYQKQDRQKPIEQDTEIRDLWVYIREWNDKFGRLPKDEDELAVCIDYVMKRQKAAWSEEDEYQINTILHGLDLKRELYKKEGNQVEEKRYKTQYDWLKSLKDRVQPQPKQEWSKEDEEMYKEVLTDIIYAKNDLKTKGCLELSNRAMKAFNWFSKRHKSLRPQSKWKPSEEQMQAIKYFIDFHRSQANASTEGWSEFKHLECLYNDLKTLNHDTRKN